MRLPKLRELGEAIKALIKGIVKAIVSGSVIKDLMVTHVVAEVAELVMSGAASLAPFIMSFSFGFN